MDSKNLTLGHLALLGITVKLA